MKEYVIYTVMFICYLIMATELAKYGLMQILIRYPPNNRAIYAITLGFIAVNVGGYLQKQGEINAFLFKEENSLPASLIVFGLFAIWIIFFRYVIMPKGLFDYNRAISRTNYWSRIHYQPGKSLESAKFLSNFSRANQTLELFKKAIEVQRKGSLVDNNNTRREIDLSGEDMSYDGMITISCPSCGMPIKAPRYAPQGAEGNCINCGAMISAKLIGNTLFINSYGTRRTRSVTPINYKDMATALEEMAFLYRMMNRFNEAHEALDEALKTVNNILSKDKDNKEFLKLKSLIIFRQAEAYQAQGINIEEVKKLYAECLVIDQLTGELFSKELVNGLIAKLS